MKKEISLKYLNYILFSLVLFLPNSSNVFYIGMILFIFCVILFLNKGKIRLIKIRKYIVYYAVIFIGSYFVHFYSKSFTEAFLFAIELFGILYFVQVSIAKSDDFNCFINVLIVIGACYAVLGILESLTSINLFDIMFNRVPETSSAAIRFGLTRNRGCCSVSINNGMLMYFFLSLSSFAVFHKNAPFILRLSYVLIFVDVILVLSRAVTIVAILTQLFLYIKLGDKNSITRNKILNFMFFTLFFTIAFFVITKENPQLVEFIKQFFGSVKKNSTDYNAANLGDFSHRISLWKWVFSYLPGHLILGRGFETIFSIKLNEYVSKTSIEVYWLFILFQRGLIGLFGFIYVQIGSMIDLIKQMKNSEIKSIYIMMIVTLLGYYVMLFSCSAFEDLRMLYIYLGLIPVLNNYTKNANLNGD